MRQRALPSTPHPLKRTAARQRWRRPPNISAETRFELICVGSALSGSVFSNALDPEGGSDRGGGRVDRRGTAAGLAEPAAVQGSGRRKPTRPSRPRPAACCRAGGGPARVVRPTASQIARRPHFPAAARIAHFSVQHNHVHLVVEADDPRALGRAMQALAQYGPAPNLGTGDVVAGERLAGESRRADSAPTRCRADASRERVLGRPPKM